MKSFIALSALAAAGMAAPAPDADAQFAGPIHAALGDLVATKRGFRPVSLEGFSEDDNQDGFVDPVGQVAPVVHAPYVAAAPLAYAHHAAPLTTITHHPVSYTQTIPLGVHRQVYTTHHVAGAPLLGAPLVAAAAPAAEAEVTEA